jgi:DNA repair photolyase
MFSTVFNPPNRFDSLDIDWEIPPPSPKLKLIDDHSRGVLTKNDSPDLGFSWSVNPYRGCTHACAYCYARPYHEYLGYSAGTDFERIILVKREAATLLRQGFHKPSWRGAPLTFSGVTDCYQSIERKLEITRNCLKVCADYRNPVSIITRSPLVLRDMDLFLRLAKFDAIRINISIPLIDPGIAAALEPGAPPPSARLKAIKALSEAGIPVGVSLAPMIPGLSDELIPKTLKLAKAAGAQWAWGGLIRLPGAVGPFFERRLREAYPNQVDRVLNRIRSTRGGKLNATTFG